MTTKNAVRMADFARLPLPQRAQQLTKLVTATQQPLNGEVACVQAEIDGFERRFNFTSDVMLAKLKAGEIKESWDVCVWLMALERRERFGKLTSPSR